MSNPYIIPVAVAALACLIAATAIGTSRSPQASRAAMPYFACFLFAFCAGGAAWEVARPVDSVAAALSVLALGAIAISAASKR